MEKQENRIAILDGIRAYAILIIMGFHIWQQSWLQGIIPSDLLRPLGISNFSLTWIPRTGYMLVDVLLLLSAFCLFLPYAQQMADPAAAVPDKIGLFYKKRAARILPPYYLCLLLSLLFLVRPTDYADIGAFWKDLLTHLTFTHTFFPETYFSSQYSTALWTLGIEVQFYLVFPFLKRLFRRFPLQTWLAMNILAEVFFSCFVRTSDGGADSFMINQFPAFLGVFANGMLAAYLCCFLRRKTSLLPKKPVARVGSLLSIASGAALICMLKDGLNHAEVVQRWQVDYRFLFSALSCVFILTLDHAHKGIQWLFSCKAVRFTARISYNLYIWHTIILLQLKKLHIPYYPEAPAGASAWPQSASGEPWHFEWQIRYTLYFWIFSVLFAAAVTYLFEEPVRRALMKIKLKKNI